MQILVSLDFSLARWEDNLSYCSVVLYDRLVQISNFSLLLSCRMVRQYFILQCGFVRQTGTNFLFLFTSLLQDGETISYIAVWFCMPDWYNSSLQCYSVLSDILVKNELCISLERGSNVLSTGDGFTCLSPPSKLKIAERFCSIYKKTISFSAIMFLMIFIQWPMIILSRDWMSPVPYCSIYQKSLPLEKLGKIAVTTLI